MKKIFNEFKEFIMTGNVLMLAIAFIMGGATKAVVDSFVADIIQPLIGAIVGKPKFDNILEIGDGKVTYGAFLTAILNLIIIGAVLFMMAKAYNTYQAKKQAAAEAAGEETADEQIVLLREIRDSLASR